MNKYAVKSVESRCHTLYYITAGGKLLPPAAVRDVLTARELRRVDSAGAFASEKWAGRAAQRLNEVRPNVRTCKFDGSYVPLRKTDTEHKLREQQYLATQGRVFALSQAELDAMPFSVLASSSMELDGKETIQVLALLLMQGRHTLRFFLSNFSLASLAAAEQQLRRKGIILVNNADKDKPLTVTTI